MLPFTPETTEELKKRFPRALDKIWVVPENLNMSDRPGLHSEHVFDFRCGTRLLISKDLYPNEGENIHVSASWEDERYLVNQVLLNTVDSPMFNTKATLEAMTKIVQNHYSSIGGVGVLKIIGISGKGIPHWVVK